MAFAHWAVSGHAVFPLRPSLFFSSAFSALRRRFSAWSFSSSVCGSCFLGRAIGSFGVRPLRLFSSEWPFLVFLIQLCMVERFKSYRRHSFAKDNPFSAYSFTIADFSNAVYWYERVPWSPCLPYFFYVAFQIIGKYLLFIIYLFINHLSWSS